MNKYTSNDIKHVLVLAKFKDGTVRQLYFPKSLNTAVLHICASDKGLLEISEEVVQGIDIVSPLEAQQMEVKG